MRIAIDLDGVVFNSEMFFMAAGELYDAMILKKNSIVKPDEPRVQNKYSWTDGELNGYIERYANSTDFDIMPFAKDVIDFLGINNELFVISARGQFNENEIIIAKEKLQNAGINFHHYFFGFLNKTEIVLTNNIDIMIDDRYDVCEALAKEGVFCIYFRMAGRKKAKTDTNIREVHNWGEIYRILDEMKVIGDMK